MIQQRAQIVLKAEDLEGFRLYASEYAKGVRVNVLLCFGFFSLTET